MRWVRPPVLAALLALALLPLVPPAAAQRAPTDDEIRSRARGILDAPGFQTTLPAAGDPGPSPPDLSGFALASLVKALFWLAAAAAVALVLYLLWDLVARRGRPRRASGPAPPPPRPPPPEPAAPLPDPEALAREGRFGEAVHALLLAALALLARRRTGLAPSLTSREVLAASDLEPDPRGALAELVAAVERFLFAGRPLDAEDWRRCRQAFERLAGGAGEAA